jgi:hypothetical protein
MRQVYLASDPVEAEIVKDYLAAHGIAAHVFGAFIWGGRGDIPVDQFPRVMIEDDAQHERARELLATYEQARGEGAAWRCPGCGEHVDGPLNACWSCGRLRDEEAD